MESGQLAVRQLVSDGFRSSIADFSVRNHIRSAEPPQLHEFVVTHYYQTKFGGQWFWGNFEVSRSLYNRGGGEKKTREIGAKYFHANPFMAAPKPASKPFHGSPARDQTRKNQQANPVMAAPKPASKPFHGRRGEDSTLWPWGTVPELPVVQWGTNLDLSRPNPQQVLSFGAPMLAPPLIPLRLQGETTPSLPAGFRSRSLNNRSHNIRSLNITSLNLRSHIMKSPNMLKSDCCLPNREWSTCCRAACQRWLSLHQRQLLSRKHMRRVFSV